MPPPPSPSLGTILSLRFNAEEARYIDTCRGGCHLTSVRTFSVHSAISRVENNARWRRGGGGGRVRQVPAYFSLPLPLNHARRERVVFAPESHFRNFWRDATQLLEESRGGGRGRGRELNNSRVAFDTTTRGVNPPVRNYETRESKRMDVSQWDRKL